MTEHTPGPWTPHEQGAHPYRFVCGPSEPVEHGEESFLVAYATGMNAEANARLIASAPDLLAALEALSNMYVHAWDRVDGGLTMFGASVPLFEKVHLAAQVAVAKAKGEPPPIVDLGDDDHDDGHALTSHKGET